MKTYEAIEQEVFGILEEELGMPQEAFSNDQAIVDLSRDSIQLFELLLAFERYYEIEALYDEVIRLQTVGDIVAYIARTKYGVETSV